MNFKEIIQKIINFFNPKNVPSEQEKLNKIIKDGIDLGIKEESLYKQIQFYKEHLSLNQYQNSKNGVPSTLFKDITILKEADISHAENNLLSNDRLLMMNFFFMVKTPYNEFMVKDGHDYVRFIQDDLKNNINNIEYEITVYAMKENRHYSIENSEKLGSFKIY